MDWITSRSGCRRYRQTRPYTEDLQQFTAWVPTYTPQGERTRVFFPDGTFEDVRISVRTLLRRTAAYSGCDPTLLRQGPRRQLYCPLPLEDTVLLPLKLRLPRCPRDGTVGYINLRFLQNYGARDDCPRILPEDAASYCSLQGDVILPIYWNIRTVCQRMNAGHALFSPNPNTTALPPWYEWFSLLLEIYEHHMPRYRR